MNICGLDLYMYEGWMFFEVGWMFGYENMGEVIEVGSGVEKVRVGDWVVFLFNILCGFCKNCECGLINYCFIIQFELLFVGVVYGFVDMGFYGGG